MTLTVCKEIEIAGVKIPACAECVAQAVDDGIGSYEFWGQKCVDKRPGIQVVSIEKLEADDDIREVAKEYIKPENYQSGAKYRLKLEAKIEAIKLLLNKQKRQTISLMKT